MTVQCRDKNRSRRPAPLPIRQGAEAYNQKNIDRYALFRGGGGGGNFSICNLPNESRKYNNKVKSF